MPLFRYDPDRPQDRVIGQGTTFRIDPWGTCLTAFHVIEDLVEYNEHSELRISIKPGIRLAALEWEGIALGGQFQLPKNAWRKLSGLNAPCIVEAKPFESPQIINSFEFASLKIEHSTMNQNRTPYLTVDLRQWKPTIGERVLAIGFADLDKGDPDASESRGIRQHLYGSFGAIIDIEGSDPLRTRAWPLVRVEAHWPGGMSGGPVFNEAGHVIGIVSTGFHDDVASATYFSAWDLPSQFLPTIDLSNPGSFRGYAVLNANDDIVWFGHDLQKMAEWSQMNGHNSPIAVSYNPETQGWTSL